MDIIVTVVNIGQLKINVDRFRIKFKSFYVYMYTALHSYSLYRYVYSVQSIDIISTLKVSLPFLLKKYWIILIINNLSFSLNQILKFTFCISVCLLNTRNQNTIIIPNNMTIILHYYIDIIIKYYINIILTKKTTAVLTIYISFHQVNNKSIIMRILYYLVVKHCFYLYNM